MYITSIMVSIGSSIILAGLVYILLVKKMHKERSSAAITEQVRAEIDRMIIDLNQTADRNIGLIEQRIKSLGDLLKEADHRISLLQKHADHISRTTDTYSRIRPNSVTTPPAGNRHADTGLQIEQEASAEAGSSPRRGTATPAGPTKPAGTAKPAGSQNQAGPRGSADTGVKGSASPARPTRQGNAANADGAGSAGGQSKRERVISLHRQGISPDIIASRVDSTVAEVELIISMTEGQR